jgi:hypothetical protein
MRTCTPAPAHHASTRYISEKSPRSQGNQSTTTTMPPKRAKTATKACYIYNQGQGIDNPQKGLKTPIFQTTQNHPANHKTGSSTKPNPVQKMNVSAY